MERRDVYTDPRWPRLRERALARDRNRCTLGWLFRSPCHETLEIHHIDPIEERPDLAFDLDNLLVACKHHHPMLEALRRSLLNSRRRDSRKCPHRHTSRYAREACERSLNAA